jgi:hypothetical protein
MNDFASALSATLHEKAQERAMSADMQHAERQLKESIQAIDRRRRVRIAVAGAAAVLVAAAGATLWARVPTSQPTQPTQPIQPTNPNRATSEPAGAPIVFHASDLPAPLTVRLPHWVGSASHFVDAAGSASAYAFSQPLDRDIRLLSVRYMYPLGAATITQPSYAALVADWEAVQPKGYGTVSNVVRNATVGGKPATTMTVTLTRTAYGLDYCDAVTGVAGDPNGCGHPEAGRTFKLAIVDEGRTVPPTVLWESSAMGDTAKPSVAAEFATWLATVRFD